MKVFWIVVDLCLMATCFVFAVVCLVQGIRGVPVEPTWSWGFWAYAAGARMAIDSIKRSVDGSE
jgi:hypothetical protein